MPVALDARSLGDHFPGIGRYVKNLAQEIGPRLTGEESLILLTRENISCRWDLKPFLGERVTLAQASASPFSLSQQWEIPSLLHKAGADLYHSPYYLMPYFAGVRTILTIHDLIPLHFPKALSLRARVFFRMAMRFAVWKADQIITVSVATCTDLVKKYRVPESKITVIPLAVEAAFRPQSPGVLRALRNRLQLPDGYVLYLGSNKPHKNLVRLVKAWAKLQPKPFPLVIAGFWDCRYDEPQELAKSLELGEAIRFLGPVEEKDLPGLYAGATLFVFPSEYEGFGLPVLEAMACGTPVITSNTSSLHGLAGGAALLVDPYDVDGMARKMNEVIMDQEKRNRLIGRGFERAREFSWEKCALETMRVYEKVMSN